MPPTRRILASLLALAVVLTGIDCPCVKAIPPAMQSAATNPPIEDDAMPCCMHHDVGGSCGGARHAALPLRGQPPCGGACERCGKAVINDTVIAAAHGASFVPHPFFAPLASEPRLRPADEPHPHRLSVRADLPPPLTSPSLLSLHCALIQ